MSDSILDALRPREREFGPFGRLASEPGKRLGDWRLARDEEGTDWLLFDRQEGAVNLLSEAALADLGEILAQLAADPPAVWCCAAPRIRVLPRRRCP